MPIRLFSLRHVPDDEADEVRELLRQNGIHYYETPPNRWLLTPGCLWLRDEDEHHAKRAKALLAEYQQQRLARARAEYQQQLEQGTAETLGSEFRRNPMRMLVYFIAMGLVLLLMLLPIFVLFG